MILAQRALVLSGYVVTAPGYPEEVMVECIEPEGYPDTWSYNIWLKGRWKNIDNIAGCIDPNRCHSSPPALPTDYSVQYNATAALPNVVNTTLNYTCARKCKSSGCDDVLYKRDQAEKVAF